MKHSEEMETILTAIYCINLTGSMDEDITNLCEIALNRCANVNYKFIGLNLIKKTKDQIMPEINELLDGETNYKKYLEGNKE